MKIVRRLIVLLILASAIAAGVYYYNQPPKRPLILTGIVMVELKRTHVRKHHKERVADPDV